jgi:hypothetical protein
MRACLDIPGDAEGGRIVDAAEWLLAQPQDATRLAATAALMRGHPYRAPNGAWSLTPLED